MDKTDDKKRGVIWGHRCGKHIGEKDFRRLVSDATGGRTSSTKALSDVEADRLIDLLEREKPRKPTGRPKRRQPERLTPGQYKYILDLGKRMGFGLRALDRIARSTFSKDRVKPMVVRSLNPGQASRFIEALKRMQERDYRAEERPSPPPRSAKEGSREVAKPQRKE